jgi:hypothetical protein
MNTMTVDLTDLLIYDEEDTTVTVTTTADWQRKGEAMGLSGMALEAYVSSGAHERHAQRIKAVKQTVISSISSEIAENMHCRLLIAAIILEADAYGVGGPNLWPDGSGSARIPCLREIAARKQSLSGSAWSAAIGAAKASLLIEAVNISISPMERINPSSCIRWLAADASLSASINGTGFIVEIEESFIPAEWQFTIVAQRLKRLTETTLTKEAIVEWSALYNRLYELKKQAV